MHRKGAVAADRYRPSSLFSPNIDLILSVLDLDHRGLQLLGRHRLHIPEKKVDSQ